MITKRFRGTNLTIPRPLYLHPLGPDYLLVAARPNVYNPTAERALLVGFIDP